MSYAENSRDPQVIKGGESPFQVQQMPSSVVNTHDFLMRCRIANINLQTPLHIVNS